MFENYNDDADFKSAIFSYENRNSSYEIHSHVFHYDWIATSVRPVIATHWHITTIKNSSWR